MSEPLPRARGRGLGWAIGGLVAVGLAAALYVIVSSLVQSEPDGLRQFRTASLDGLEFPEAPQPAFTGAFTDATGVTRRASEFEGGVTLVNLWATWCAPCRTEMPTLARLQRDYADRGLRVVAISLDTRGGEPAARQFLGRHAPLSFFHDPVMATYNSLRPRPRGLPVTVVLDGRGREVARLTGEGDWSSPEARGLVEQLLAEAPARPAQAPDSAS